MLWFSSDLVPPRTLAGVTAFGISRMTFPEDDEEEDDYNEDEDEVFVVRTPCWAQGIDQERSGELAWCLNMLMMTLFLWQAVTGMQILNRIWDNRPA